MHINCKTKQVIEDKDPKEEFYKQGKEAGFSQEQLDFMWKFKLLEKKYEKW